MSMHEDMKSLTQEISSSHEARGATIASIAKAASAQRQAAQKQVRELSVTRQAIAQQQRADRAQAETQRSSQVHAWVKDMAQDHAGAREEWQRLTTSMQAKRTGNAAEVRLPYISGKTASKRKSQEKDSSPRLVEAKREESLNDNSNR